MGGLWTFSGTAHWSPAHAFTCQYLKLRSINFALNLLGMLMSPQNANKMVRLDFVTSSTTICWNTEQPTYSPSLMIFCLINRFCSETRMKQFGYLETLLWMYHQCDLQISSSNCMMPAQHPWRSWQKRALGMVTLLCFEAWNQYTLNCSENAYDILTYFSQYADCTMTTVD